MSAFCLCCLVLNKVYTFRLLIRKSLWAINPGHSCNGETAAMDAANHFRGVTKMIEVGKGDQRLSIWNAEIASNPQGYKRVDGHRLIKTIQEAFGLN
ncbi:hypothetical protein [Pseudomonas sp. GM79]|uniref:hypothetical protein n=1 Tax=Pseudomonas sp. GM79 TaxID=1144338 RepID=UPI0012FB0A79|nr:hypothetical protein [Pseudomonas sp. GM79]